MFSTVKKLLYSAGGLTLYHTVRNRRHVTVVMFHRVLVENDPRWKDVNNEWTISDSLFDECLQFFSKHYNVVPVDAVAGATERSKLPPRPLVITFDDGWSETETVALPILRRYAFPAVVFVVADAVNRRHLWTETLFHAWNSGRLNSENIARLGEFVGLASDPSSCASVGEFWRMVDGLRLLAEQDRETLLAEIGLTTRDMAPEMLCQAQLRTLASSQVVIGSHGLTHRPLAVCDDPAVELTQSRCLLGGILPERQITFLSFPHGSCNTRVIECAQEAGYGAAFTSVPVLNRVPNNPTGLEAFGRINVSALQIAGDDGRLRPELLAFWLFPRDARRLRPAEAPWR